MLNIKLFSFSYLKSGIPVDETPHKGGFVFDCRYIKNPRWEPELQNLTGKDKPVIDFLKNTQSMQEFLKNIHGIISDAIDNYISRNFTSLMISFGCTGGQHRSMYAAEEIYKFLLNKYNGKIQITLTHIEYPEFSRK